MTEGLTEKPRYLEAPLFNGVPLNSLREIVADMRCEYENGENLLRKDAAENALLVILDGEVDIIGRDPHGREMYLLSRRAGQVVGEQSIVRRTAASADVVARGRVAALKIPADIANRLIDEQSAFARNLLVILSDKLHEATDDRVKHRLEQKLLFAHFSSHVSRQFVSELLNKGEDAGAARTVEAIVMFTDLRDFTKHTAALDDAGRVVEDLEPYFETIVDIVHQSGGIVDKFIGDAVMAVWGHPALGKANPDKVMDAILEMVRRTRALRFAGEPLRIGIGIEHGAVFMGNIGSEDKRSFTVLGSPVNFAARYESANKDDDGTVYAITTGPAFYGLLSEQHKAILVARKDVRIKGAPDNKQTVFSMKDDDNGLEPR